MQRKFHVGSTSNTTEIFLQDSSSTTGGVLSNLVYNSPGLIWRYHREGSAVGVNVTLAAGVIGTYTNSGGAGTGGGFVSLDTIGMSGQYEISIPDAAVASGAKYVTMNLRGATNMPPIAIFIELDKMDYNNDQNGGMYNLQASIGVSGIRQDSFTKVNELTSAPSFPTEAYTMMSWIFTRSLQKTDTTAGLDRVYKANTTTPFASSILTDDNITFTRGAYQ
jgi:hypothetical protein